MARTTLILRDDVMAQLRALAAREQRTLTEQIDIVLRRGLGASTARETVAKYRFEPVTGDGGLMPGIDLSDMKSVREKLDELDGRS